MKQRYLVLPVLALGVVTAILSKDYVHRSGWFAREPTPEELKESCDHDNAEDCYRLGMYLHEELQAIPVCYQKVTKACALGHVKACTEVAIHLYRGIGLPEGESPDPAKAAHMFEQSCNRDDTLACYQLAGIVLQGQVAPADPQRAHSLFTRACEARVPEACDALQLHALFGRFSPTDIASGEAYYQKLCDQGRGQACWFLFAARGNKNSIIFDAAKSRDYLARGCRAGYAQDCDQLKNPQ